MWLSCVNSLCGDIRIIYPSLLQSNQSKRSHIRSYYGKYFVLHTWVKCDLAGIMFFFIRVEKIPLQLSVTLNTLTLTLKQTVHQLSQLLHQLSHRPLALLSNLDNTQVDLERINFSTKSKILHVRIFKIQTIPIFSFYL